MQLVGTTTKKAAAWLCAPSQWTAYVDEEKASYAIGGPSVEMYVDSYNQVPHTEAGNYTLGATYSETNTPGYIYIKWNKVNYIK